MAAFCACCGAEITLKAEACVVCGTPRHGMVSGLLPTLGAGTDTPQEDVKIGRMLRRPPSDKGSKPLLNPRKRAEPDSLGNT
jgi:hypothetical protein